MPYEARVEAVLDVIDDELFDDQLHLQKRVKRSRDLPQRKQIVRQLRTATLQLESLWAMESIEQSIEFSPLSNSPA